MSLNYIFILWIFFGIIVYVNCTNVTCTDGSTKDCGNGTCTQPGVCTCVEGYAMVGETCKPVCNECNNGVCTAPDKCECNSGFLQEDSKCLPHCSKKCGSGGNCIAPEACECSAGYKYTDSCDPSCCQPYCSKPCTHGSCVSPDLCECDKGYEKDFEFPEYICVPTCSFECGNGKCIDIDQCKCNPGYEPIAAENNDEVCQPVCKNCAGYCVKPYTCECDLQYTAKHEALDGSECDCFVNCSKNKKLCERTNCVPNDDANQVNEKTQRTTPAWIYVTVLMLLFTIVVVILIVKRQAIAQLYGTVIRGGSYILDEEYDDASSVRMSNIEKNQNSRRDY